MDQEMFIDEKFVVVFQNTRTGSEHKVIVTKSELDDVVQFHKKRGHLVNYVPATGVMDTNL